MCMVFITILTVLLFQIVGLISLEMNVYVVSDSQGSNNLIPKFASKMKKLAELNDLKPKFYLRFSPEFQTSSRFVN